MHRRVLRLVRTQQLSRLRAGSVAAGAAAVSDPIIRQSHPGAPGAGSSTYRRAGREHCLGHSAVVSAQLATPDSRRLTPSALTAPEPYQSPPSPVAAIP